MPHSRTPSLLVQHLMAAAAGRLAQVNMAAITMGKVDVFIFMVISLLGNIAYEFNVEEHGMDKSRIDLSSIPANYNIQSSAG